MQPCLKVWFEKRLEALTHENTHVRLAHVCVSERERAYVCVYVCVCVLCICVHVCAYIFARVCESVCA
jgi:hypothetical protein